MRYLHYSILLYSVFLIGVPVKASTITSRSGSSVTARATSNATAVVRGTSQTTQSKLSGSVSVTTPSAVQKSRAIIPKVTMPSSVTRVVVPTTKSISRTSLPTTTIIQPATTPAPRAPSGSVTSPQIPARSIAPVATTSQAQAIIPPTSPTKPKGAVSSFLSDALFAISDALTLNPLKKSEKESAHADALMVDVQARKATGDQNQIKKADLQMQQIRGLVKLAQDHAQQAKDRGDSKADDATKKADEEKKKADALAAVFAIGGPIQSPPQQEIKMVKHFGYSIEKLRLFQSNLDNALSENRYPKDLKDYLQRVKTTVGSQIDQQTKNGN